MIYTRLGCFFIGTIKIRYRAHREAGHEKRAVERQKRQRKYFKRTAYLMEKLKEDEQVDSDTSGKISGDGRMERRWK